MHPSDRQRPEPGQKRLTLEQEMARMAAMHGNPILAETLRTAPTLAELAKLAKLAELAELDAKTGQTEP